MGVLGFAALAACSLTTSLDGLTGGPVETADASAPMDASPPMDASDEAKIVPSTGWAFRKSLTVDKSVVPSATDLAEFPLLVSLTDADLRTTDSGGKVANGRDLAFFAADGVTPLAYEIESYASTTGQIIAWVKLPVLSATMGAKLYLAFGNAQVTASLEDRKGVWSSGFAAVWHMADATWTDSASGSTGNPVGVPTIVKTGQIGTAASFGATDVYVGVGPDARFQPTSITVSAWANPGSVGSAPDRHPYMLDQDTYRDTASNPRGYYMEIYRTQTNPRPTFYTANGTELAHAFATTSVVNGTWYHVVGTRDETSGLTRIYVNGVEEGSATMTGGIAYLPNKVQVGGFGSQSWDGLLDEVRIAKGARDAGWIRTEYANQSAPEKFVTVGPLQTTP